MLTDYHISYHVLATYFSCPVRHLYALFHVLQTTNTSVHCTGDFFTHKRISKPEHTLNSRPES